MTNTIVNQPSAVSLQTTDYFLTWQGSQSPSTRKTPVSGLSAYYATLTGANTFGGKITVSSGGASITGDTSVTGALSVSGTLTSGGVSATGTSTFNGAVAVVGNSVVLDNAQFFAGKDTGAVARGLLGVDASNHTLFQAASTAGFLWKAAGGSTLMSQDNSGNAAITGGLTINSGQQVVTNSGTWSINIGGNAATATNATNLGGGGTCSAVTVTSSTAGGFVQLASGSSTFQPAAPSVGFAWCAFNSGASNVGSITFTGVGASYNSASDETLKIIDGPLTDVGATIDALQPIWFRWKSAPDAEPQPGFGAQTTCAVFPWAVTPGDGERPWQMDQAKLMSLAIAEIKALRARVAELEAKWPS